MDNQLEGGLLVFPFRQHPGHADAVSLLAGWRHRQADRTRDTGGRLHACLVLLLLVLVPPLLQCKSRTAGKVVNGYQPSHGSTGKRERLVGGDVVVGARIRPSRAYNKEFLALSETEEAFLAGYEFPVGLYPENNLALANWHAGADRQTDTLWLCVLSRCLDVFSLVLMYFSRCSASRQGESPARLSHYSLSPGFGRKAPGTSGLFGSIKPSALIPRGQGA